MKTEDRKTRVKPFAYMASGKHASFPKLLVIGEESGSGVGGSSRSTGVQSTTRTGQARSRQTRVFQYCSPPLRSDGQNVKLCGMTRGGLQKNNGGNTSLQWLRGSMTQGVARYSHSMRSECY